MPETNLFAHPLPVPAPLPDPLASFGRVGRPLKSSHKQEYNRILGEGNSKLSTIVGPVMVRVLFYYYQSTETYYRKHVISWISQKGNGKFINWVSKSTTY